MEHSVVRYRQLCKDYADTGQRALVLETARRMVMLCLYTALTTILAFMSLVMGGIKLVIDFGWMMTIGLSVTFLTTFLLFPGILVSLPRSAVALTESLLTIRCIRLAVSPSRRLPPSLPPPANV